MTGDAVGGVWTYALDLASGLGRAGLTTTLIVAGPRPSRDQLRSAEGVPGLTLVITDAALDWTAMNEGELARSAAVVARIATSHRADIVHLNSPALAAYASFDVPVLGVCHSCAATWWAAVKVGIPPAGVAWRIGATAAGYAACDTLVAPSQAFAEATAAAYGAPAPGVIHNGRAPRIEPPRPRERLVLTASRLWDEGKDVQTLDRAAARIDADVVALGPLAAPDGCNVAFDRLKTPGVVASADVASWMARAQVFASAARYEPFGLSVLEAAQAGLPLVLSDIPTFRELWEGAAVFVPPGDADGFAAAITRLLDAPDERRSTAAAARHRSERYGLDAMTCGYLGLIDHLRSARVPA
jgi:glycosyltransferase involved in cell wall biosynthesis